MGAPIIDTTTRDADVVGELLFGDSWDRQPPYVRRELVVGDAPAAAENRPSFAPPAAAVPAWMQLYQRFASRVGIDPRPPSTDARSALLAVVRQYDYLVVERAPQEGHTEPVAILPLRSRAEARRATNERLTVFRTYVADDRIVLYNVAGLFAPYGAMRNLWGIRTRTASPDSAPILDVMRRTTLRYYAPGATTGEVYVPVGFAPLETSAAIFVRAAQLDARAPDDGVLNIAVREPGALLVEPGGAYVRPAVVWLTGRRERYTPVGPRAVRLWVRPEGVLINGDGADVRVRSLTCTIYRPAGATDIMDPRASVHSRRRAAELSGARLLAQGETWQRIVCSASDWYPYSLGSTILVDLEIKLGIERTAYAAAAADAAGSEPSATVTFETFLVGEPAITRAERAYLPSGANGEISTAALDVASPERPSALGMPDGSLQGAIRLSAGHLDVGAAAVQSLRLDLASLHVRSGASGNPPPAARVSYRLQFGSASPLADKQLNLGFLHEDGNRTVFWVPTRGPWANSPDGPVRLVDD